MFESKYCSYHVVNRKDAFHAASITDCPYCEIDRLTAMLAERDAEIKGLEEHLQLLREHHNKQLSASQQECERLKEELEASDWAGEQACKAIEKARKQAAREALQFIDPVTAIHAKRYFGLEGEG